MAVDDKTEGGEKEAGDAVTGDEAKKEEGRARQGKVGAEEETTQDFRLFEGPGDGSRRVRHGSIRRDRGAEGSTRGQVEKTEDFGQSQPEDEVRCQGALGRAYGAPAGVGRSGTERRTECTVGLCRTKTPCLKN